MGVVGQGDLAARYGTHTELLGGAGKLHRAAHVGVGQGQRRVAQLRGPGQQLVRVRRPLSKGEEAVGVKLDIFRRHVKAH